jgi:putative ABC transport system substrate-binding protein
LEVDMVSLGAMLTVILSLSLFAAPLAAEAQQAGRVARIGTLTMAPGPTPHLRTAFLEGLRAHGWIVGENIIIEPRYAAGDPARLDELALELVRLPVDVIWAPSEVEVNAVRKATSTIPIVFTGVADPVAVGYAVSLARPGGMMTGASTQWYEWTGKRMELLKETLPQAQPVAVLTNPPEVSPALAAGLKDLEQVSRSLRLSYQTYLATEAGDVDRAVATMARDGARSLVVLSSTPLFYVERKRLADLALKYRLPTMTEYREAVAAGCLMSYAPSLSDLVRRSATYVAKILKGAKPADLPIEQPTKFEFIINLKTAKALGLTIPPSVLARADEIID